MAKPNAVFAISDSSSNDSADLPISPEHFDFDDLKNDMLELENSSPQAAFDQLLDCISDDMVDVDAEASAKDDSKTIENGRATNEDDEASTHSTVESAKSERSDVGGIKLVPIESLLKSTEDTSKKAKETKPAKSHSVSSGSVEELSSETTNDDSDDDDDDGADDVEFSRSRHKRKTRNKKDLKKRFKKLREKAQAKRPNYAERSNSEESDANSDGDENQDSNADARKNTARRNRNANTKPSSSAKPRNIYGATVRLAKLPSNMETLLLKYDLIEIRDRHQKILASRPRTHRNEVYTGKHIYERKISILDKHESLPLSMLGLLRLHITHTAKQISQQKIRFNHNENSWMHLILFQKQSKSVSKRLLNDGNCGTSDGNADNQLTEPAAKKQVSIVNFFFCQIEQFSGRHEIHCLFFYLEIEGKQWSVHIEEIW